MAIPPSPARRRDGSRADAAATACPSRPPTADSRPPPPDSAVQRCALDRTSPWVVLPRSQKSNGDAEPAPSVTWRTDGRLADGLAAGAGYRRTGLISFEPPGGVRAPTAAGSPS